MQRIDVLPDGIGPSFHSDLELAGLKGLPIVVGDYYVDYENTGPNSLSPAEISALQTVIDDHDHTLPAPPNLDELRRQEVVNYAAYLDTLSVAEGRQEVGTPPYEGFLDNIEILGSEGF